MSSFNLHVADKRSAPPPSSPDTGSAPPRSPPGTSAEKAGEDSAPEPSEDMISFIINNSTVLRELFTIIVVTARGFLFLIQLMIKAEMADVKAGMADVKAGMADIKASLRILDARLESLDK